MITNSETQYNNISTTVPIEESGALSFFFLKSAAQHDNQSTTKQRHSSCVACPLEPQII